MPAPSPRITAALAVLGLVLAGPESLSAQDRKDAAESNLERLEKELTEKEQQKAELEEQAQEAADAATALSRQLVEAASDIRMSEEEALRLEDRIKDLEAETETKKDQLDARRGELLKLLSALERLSKRPVAFALLQPTESITTARTASLMGRLIPEINKQSVTLRQELGILASLQDALSRERFDLKNTLSELTQRQLKLGSLLVRRKQEASRASAQAKAITEEITDIASKAASLKELVDKLEQQAAKLRSIAPVPVSPGTRDPLPRAIPSLRQSITKMKGLLTFPAMGSIVKQFGEREGAGHVRGLRIRTRESAQIVSPYDGQIVFAGPFRNYGQLLIISHGDGYHSLLAGLNDLQAVVGQWVLAGEPVGAMSDDTDRSELYVELRQNGESIDPAPWLSRQTASAR
ncbi:MAG: peptidoglycan DD-metalloendopeptidase family protein [Alphaproteobacteria bacterium]|nr:peptidoglycan DD-metalloendopeptidase family protein [Alphaproteobacteria bacterium]